MRTRSLMLVIVILAMASIFLWGCGQQQESGSDSVVGAKSGGPEGFEEECSVTVPDPEPEDLSSLALITADQAREAALAAYPGATVTEVELDNENGCLVYSVELNEDMDVMVDAGNGTILGIETDDDHEDEGDVDEDDEYEDEDDDDEDEDDEDEDDEDDLGGGK